MRSPAAAIGATSAQNDNGEAVDGEEEWEVEQRRREYLRRHREMLLQKQRLETERRLQEHERDAAAIQKRLDDVRATKQHEQRVAAKSAHALASGTPPFKQQPIDTTTRLPGIYACIDDLSTDALRVVAEQQPMQRDVAAPLNTRGKYHTRFMRDRYPIAGSQFTLERERELFVAAKTKLLLESSTASRTAPARRDADVDADVPRMHKSLSLGSNSVEQQPSRTLDFYTDKLATMLATEATSLEQLHVERHVRLIDVQHERGLQQFWTLFYTAHAREVVAWLKAHSFFDVNVPVRRVKANSSSVSSGELSRSATHEVVEVALDRMLGVTPLMAACTCQSADLVTALLAQGAVTHLVTANGDTALHCVWRAWLAKSSSSSTRDANATSVRAVVDRSVRATSTLAIVTALVANGADVNAQNAFGETALQVCGKFGLDACATLLLAHGGDPFKCDRHGKSAVAYAREHGHETLRRQLANYSVVERVRARETERQHCKTLLKRGRGALSSTWSQQSPESLLARLDVHQQCAGYLRNQYVDRTGHVLVYESDSDGDDGGGAT